MKNRQTCVPPSMPDFRLSFRAKHSSVLALTEMRDKEYPAHCLLQNQAGFQKGNHDNNAHGSKTNDRTADGRPKT